MSEPIDPNSIKAQIVHLKGAASLLTAIDMGLIELTPQIISSTVWTLRDVADRIELLEAMQVGGEILKKGRYAEPVESEGGQHD
ncbi:MAG: hypothetical protein EHM62_05795 [Methylococcus sp.]|nr:MAG: hypothetical protein EHM62_05795 [Methylococcus sp.]